MAAESNHNRKRVDSVIDAEPISQTLATAQKYCSAMSLLASENGFRALSEVLELLPRRENEIRTRDETIKDLNTKLAAQEKSHKAFNQKQMENFEERYSDWDEEKTTLQGEVEELEEAAKDQDMEVEALRRELEKTNSRVKDFEEERTKNIKGLKKLEQQVAELEGKLQNTQANADKHKNELEGSYDQVAALKKSLEEETNKVSNLVTRTTKMKERLETFRQFSVEIVDLNLQATVERIEDLWRSAMELVRDLIGRDLPEEILQRDWTKLRENDIFKNRVPLPQSNSETAKKMRVATVLGVLATLIDKVVFQPTFLLHDDSELRDYLRIQATIDPSKERYTRGILLSMFPEVQERNVEDGIRFIVDEVLMTANVQLLLAPENIAAFEEALEHLISQFKEAWKTVQRGKQKLESSFHYSLSPGFAWYVFDMDVAQGKDGKHNEVPLVTGTEEDDIVVVPRVYTMETKGATPVSHGYVLRKAHLEAANDEVRKGIPSAPFTRTASSRHRHRPSRTMSVSGHGASGGHPGEIFLSQTRGAPNV